jgi:hypothetical protein
LEQIFIFCLSPKLTLGVTIISLLRSFVDQLGKLFWKAIWKIALHLAPFFIFLKLQAEAWGYYYVTAPQFYKIVLSFRTFYLSCL